MKNDDDDEEEGDGESDDDDDEESADDDDLTLGELRLISCDLLVPCPTNADLPASYWL